MITHPSLLESLAVDIYVDSPYNFISGANGTKAAPFFQHPYGAQVAASTSSLAGYLRRLVPSTTSSVAPTVQGLCPSFVTFTGPCVGHFYHLISSANGTRDVCFLQRQQ
jgi:hypothetical protein